MGIKTEYYQNLENKITQFGNNIEELMQFGENADVVPSEDTWETNAFTVGQLMNFARSIYTGINHPLNYHKTKTSILASDIGIEEKDFAGIEGFIAKELDKIKYANERAKELNKLPRTMLGLSKEEIEKKVYNTFLEKVFGRGEGMQNVIKMYNEAKSNTTVPILSEIVSEFDPLIETIKDSRDLIEFTKRNDYNALESFVNKYIPSLKKTTDSAKKFYEIAKFFTTERYEKDRISYDEENKFSKLVSEFNGSINAPFKKISIEPIMEAVDLNRYNNWD